MAQKYGTKSSCHCSLLQTVKRENKNIKATTDYIRRHEHTRLPKIFVLYTLALAQHSIVWHFATHAIIKYINAACNTDNKHPFCCSLFIYYYFFKVHQKKKEQKKHIKCSNFCAKSM